MTVREEVAGPRPPTILQITIYALIHDGEVVYVGQTKNPARREWQQRNKHKRVFEDFVVLAEVSSEDATIAEIAFHRLHGVPLNAQGGVGWTSASGSAGGGKGDSTKRRAAASVVGKAYGPANAQKLGKAHGRANIAKTNARRYRCDECTLTTTPGNVSQHQNRTGHKGRTEVTA